jgi:hypothetical protein
LSYEPSLNLRLYGTEEEPEPQQTIVTGSLSVVLQSGNLRNITIGGHEAIRRIAFVVRDKDWGTFKPTIYDLEVDQQSDRFGISYRAECGNDQQTLAYSAVISGSADGALNFVVTGGARTDFLTNRTGFVVLHPIDGVAGREVTLTHTDGSVEQSLFPERIKPSQPFSDIRALTHRIAPGLSVTCTMTGDSFETEDQRNWTDASYKTYIRPLAKPHPFTLKPDEGFEQCVYLGVSRDATTISAEAKDHPVEVKVGQGVRGKLPEIALAVDPDYLGESLAAMALIRRSAVSRLFCNFDASAGHDASVMGGFRQLAEQTGASLVLEAILPLRDEMGQFTDDTRVLDKDLAAIRDAAHKARVSFSMISASPACYLKSHQPSGPWPSAPPLAEIYAKVRETFPESAIAAGMHSYFTEFNRLPPPAHIADVITHSTSPIVHASDDLSVMETLQALPWVFASAKQLGGSIPYWIGPTAIGMRFNPYGSATMPNPGNVRAAMATIDPRQRGVFNAAWTLGYIAQATAAGVDGLCLSAAAGPFGIAWQKMEWLQPWFDEHGVANSVFPVYHVIAGCAKRSGATATLPRTSDPTKIASLWIEASDERELWLANLTAGQCDVQLEGIDAAEHSVQRLDSETFERNCTDPDRFLSNTMPLASSAVRLSAYAVLRISSARTN